MNTERVHDYARDPHEPPRLEALDLGALGVQTGPSDALACDINDPDCELPDEATGTASLDRADAEDGGARVESTSDGGN